MKRCRGGRCSYRWVDVLVHEHLVLTGLADIADATVVRSTRARFSLGPDDDHAATAKAEIVAVDVIGLVPHG